MLVLELSLLPIKKEAVRERESPGPFPFPPFFLECKEQDGFCLNEKIPRTVRGERNVLSRSPHYSDV
jgi:hypothetical protein